jgi:hypothetical protein
VVLGLGTLGAEKRWWWYLDPTIWCPLSCTPVAVFCAVSQCFFDKFVLLALLIY